MLLGTRNMRSPITEMAETAEPEDAFSQDFREHSSGVDLFCSLMSGSQGIPGGALQSPFATPRWEGKLYSVTTSCAEFLEEGPVTEERFLVRQLVALGPGVGWHANGNICTSTMKVVCAWCLGEGKPGDLGEREPLEDPEVTHSICASHTDQLLEAFPSRSFPDAALLIVVRRNDAALYEHLECVHGCAWRAGDCGP
jgi:hypothetical protein